MVSSEVAALRLLALDGLEERLEVALTLRGQIDVCFLFEVQVQPEVRPSLIRERHFRVAVAADHPLAEHEAVSLTELAGHPGALLDVEPASYLNEALLARFGVSPRIAYRSTNVQTIRSLVGRGLAWSLLMLEVTASHDGWPLRFLPIIEDLGTNSVVAAQPRGLRATRLVDAVVGHCRDALPP